MQDCHVHVQMTKLRTRTELNYMKSQRTEAIHRFVILNLYGRLLLKKIESKIYCAWVVLKTSGWYQADSRPNGTFALITEIPNTLSNRGIFRQDQLCKLQPRRLMICS